MVVATQEKRAATKEQAVPARKDEQALQQIQVALKQMIESVYTDGIDRLLNAYIDKDGNIAGKFADAGQIYDFTLSEDGQIDYVEGRLTNDSLQQWTSSVRFDAPVAPGGKKKRKCTTGKVCKNTCIAKGLKCSEAIAPNLQQQIPGLKQAISQIQGSASQRSAEESQRQENTKRAATGAAISTAVVVGALGLAAWRVSKDLERSQVEFGSIRQPPNGVPDEETFKYYDSLKPGDLIRKNFKAPGWGTRQHYGVYYGRDPKTGEHLMVETTIDKQSPDGTPRVFISPLTREAGENSTQYEKVPPEDMYKRPGAARLSRQEVLERAKAMVGVTFSYKGFDSNCESLARGLVEGVAYSTQGDRVSGFTKFIANVLTDNASKIKVGSGEGEGIKIGNLRIYQTEYSKDEFRMSAQEMVKYLEQKKREELRRSRMDAERIKGSVSTVDVLQLVLSPKDREPDGKDITSYLQLRSPQEYASTVETLAGQYPGVGDEIRIDLYKNYLLTMFGLTSKGDRLKKEDSADVKTGKRCGKGYIAKDLKCSRGAGSEAQQNITGLKNAIEGSAPQSGSSGGRTALIAGAALTGLPIASYLLFKQKYRAGFDESAKIAKKDSKGFTDYVPDELTGGWGGRNGKPANQITFVVGGFAQEGGKNSLRWAEQLEQKDDLFDDNFIVPLSNEDFDLPASATGDPVLKVGGQTILSDRNVAQFRVMLGTAIEKGRNPSSVRMAAAAYAFHQKHPDKPINLMGYSAGGMVTHEAAEILDKMGVKNVRVANFGSPHWGLTEKVGPSVTFSSPNDPGLGNIPVRERVDVNSVADHFSYLKNPDVRKRLKDFLDGREVQSDRGNLMSEADRKKADRRKRAAERAMRMAQTVQSGKRTDSSPYQFVVSAINSIYLDKLDRLLSASVNDRDEIVGLFLDENQVYEYKILPDGRLEYVESKQKFDSYLEGYGVGRSDAPKKRRCKIGKVCGSTCIAKGLKCKQFLPPKLSQQLPMIRSALRQSEPIITPEAEQQVKDPLETMTIRELKKEASTRGISRYNVMTKEELVGAIKAVDADPEQQERIRRTLDRKQKEQEVDPVNSWKRIVRSRKGWGRNDLEAAWKAGTVLLGVSLTSYGWMKNRYQGNFAKSANTAQNRAKSLDLPNVGNKKYITFTVDGFSADSDPNKGRNLSTALFNADPEKMKSHHIVPIDGAEFTDLASIPVEVPAALRTPIGLTLSVARSLKTTLINGSNPKSVDLAAQVLAFHKKYPDKRMNLVGHGAGGQVVNEAIEILHFANPQLASDLRVTNIGTPNFGLTEQRAGVRLGNRSSRGRTITVSSANDPLDIFPKISPVMVNTVASHDINAYLGDERARQVIIESVNDPPVPRPSKKPAPKKRRTP